MSRIALLAALFFALPASAMAATQGAPKPPQVSIIDSPCPGAGESFAAGCTYMETRTIYRDSSTDKFVLRHEMGHLFDAEELTNGDRSYFMRLMHISGPWYGTEVGQESPSEYFADEYAACSLHFVVRGTWESGYAHTPTKREYRQFCPALWRIAARAATSSRPS